jgi:hypothetical protein
MCILEYKTTIMKKIIAFFKRLFGVKAEVIVIPEPTKKKRKPRNKRKPKPKVTEDIKIPILNEEPKKKRKPRPKRKPKPRTEGGEPFSGGSGRQPHNKK